MIAAAWPHQRETYSVVERSTSNVWCKRARAAGGVFRWSHSDGPGCRSRHGADGSGTPDWYSAHSSS